MTEYDDLSFFDDLSFLRDRLDQLNNQYFKLILTRKNHIKKIQKTKNQIGVSEFWDPKREMDVFQKFCNEFPGADQSLDLMYSLLIESQAAENHTYPRWSRCEHLLEKKSSLDCLINPVLLFVRDEELFDRLDLNPKFRSKLKNLHY